MMGRGGSAVATTIDPWSWYHVKYLATLALGSSNSDQSFSKSIQNLDQPFQVATLAPKWAKPFGAAPPTLILDPVFLIRIDSHVVLFIDVYLLKYSYLETRSHCVNSSFIILSSRVQLQPPGENVGKRENVEDDWIKDIIHNIYYY